MLFDDWNVIVRTVLIGIALYFFVILILRTTGKRTLSKWNAFDFVLTIALGSTLAAAVLQPTTSLAEGAAVLALFVLLQYLVTWAAVRSRFIRRLVKADPTLLFHQGEFIEEAMRRERVPEAEVLAALRERGIGSLDGIHAVVLETDGTFSAIESASFGPRSTLVDVAGYDHSPDALPPDR